MWPYIKATCTNAKRNNNGYIKWDNKIKENNEYFRFENENSHIRCMKKGTIKVHAVIAFASTGNNNEIHVNSNKKVRNMNFSGTSNSSTTFNEILEVNVNDSIQVYASGDPYNQENTTTRIQIEMLNVS